MLKRLIPILLASAILLTACGGGEPTQPPVSAVDIQNTAAAAAQTIVAQTAAAQPTATSLPPTEVPSPTPLPTFTPDPMLFPPTSVFPTLIVPTPTTASGPDDCNHPLNRGAAGPTNPMRIENETGGTITVISLFLNKNAFGQCGFVAYNNIKKNDKLRIDLPKGDWWATAIISYGGNKSGNSYGGFTIRLGDEDLLRIVVKPESIRTMP